MPRLKLAAAGLKSCATALVGLAVLQADAQQSAGGQQAFAFLHANVIPMDRETVLQDHTVIVQGDRVVAVGPAADVKVPAGATRVDATGKYLIPALAEMHAHVPGGDASDAAIERVLRLYAANGIGTIRGMLGHPRHLALRDRIAKGELFSPVLYTSGPSLNGNSVPDVATGTAAVTEQKQAGYDFLKIHPGVKRDVFDAIDATADKLGISFAGHVPADVGLTRALEARYASIDHLDGYIEALVRDGAPATASQWFGINLVGQIDETKIPRLVSATKAAGVWMVPTETLLENTADDEPADAKAKRPEMKHAEPGQLEQWTAATNKIRSAADAPSRARFIAVRRRLIKELHAGGVPFLLGSDSPQIWNVPGFSIHRELSVLVAAGLTPYQALETGTVNVATFFKADSGVVASGRRADLLLLDGNPLENIANTSRISGVMLRGRWRLGDELLAGEVHEQ